ncbi:RNA-directed DNA polymerase [Tanacetum coccineum]
MPQAEFAYNRSKSRTTRKTPFEVVTGVNPITPLDPTPIVKPAHFSSEGEKQAKQVQQLHENVRAHIEKQNAKYKEQVDKCQKKVVFKEGDMVWIRLGKERFPADLPGEYNVSATFNVADLSPYVTDEETNEPEQIGNVEQDSRTNLFLAGEYGGLEFY